MKRRPHYRLTTVSFVAGLVALGLLLATATGPSESYIRAEVYRVCMRDDHDQAMCEAERRAPFEQRSWLTEWRTEWRLANWPPR
jgi:hypothetical protein